MIPHLVIFDCDGVLVDTEATTDAVISANLAQFGLNLSASEVHSLFAGGTMKGVADEAKARGARLPDNWLPQIYDEIFTALERGVEVIPGVLDLIDRINAAGLKTAIASNGPVKKMQISLTPSGLWDRFAGRIYSGHDHGAKPKPDMLLQIMSDLGAAAEDTVMIDDMAAGCLAARAAKVRCFGYVADGDPRRVNGTNAIPVTSMDQIREALGLR